MLLYYLQSLGIMCILDDICSQIHAQNEGADDQFLVELNKYMSQNEHYQSGAQCFIIKHYAGAVCFIILLIGKLYSYYNF